MKASLVNLLKEFSKESEEVQELLKQVFDFENQNSNTHNPQYKKNLNAIIDSIIEKKEKSERIKLSGKF